jgi:hypothetical protein
MYRIVHKITSLLTKKIECVILPVVLVLCLTSRSWDILLCRFNGQTVLPSELRGHEHFSIPIGGGRQYLFSNSSVVPFIKQGSNQLTPDYVFRYVNHMDDIGCLAYPLEQGFVYADLTLSNIVPFLSRQMVQKIARIHNISFSSRWNLTKNDIVKMFDGHSCINCSLYASVLEARFSPSLIKKEASARFTSLEG